MTQSEVKSQFNQSQWGFCFLCRESSHASRETKWRMKLQLIVLVFFHCDQQARDSSAIFLFAPTFPPCCWRHIVLTDLQTNP